MENWEEVIQLIPEYDPVSTAGFMYESWEDVCDEEVGDFWFDLDTAKWAVEFFPEVLEFVKGAKGGEPFELEPFQKSIVGNIFGWKRADGFRRYREVLLLIPRKNGKTPLAAGISSLLFYGFDEPGAEIYSAAADTDGTRELWDFVHTNYKRSQHMQKVAKDYVSRKAIQKRGKPDVFRCVSADSRRGHSYNTYGAVIDEVHLHKDGKLVDAFETSTSARDEPLIMLLTTRDTDRDSICNQKEDYALKVRNGTIDDPAFLPVCYIPPEDDDEGGAAGWKDIYENPELWKKVNPNLGVSKKMTYMKRQIKRAKKRPTRRNAILRLDLNVKVGSSAQFIQLGDWDSCTDVDHMDYEEVAEWRTHMLTELEGETCFGAIDLSANRDLTAFVLWFIEHDVVLPWFWIPEDTAIDHEETDKLPYTQWFEHGFVDYCAGQTINTDLVEEKVEQCADMYDIQSIAIDRWNSLSVVTDLMDSLGDDKVVGYGQGYASMSYPTKEMERRILDGSIDHGGNPILRSNIGALSVKQKRDEADNVKPDKDKSSSRIDGAVATIMALGLAMQEPVNTGTSKYETEGLTTI